MTDYHENERTLYESSGMQKMEKAPVYSDGIPTLLKVNQVTYLSSEMSSDQSVTARDMATKSIEVVQIALTTGIKSIETIEHSPRQQKWLKGLNSIAGCAEIVKGIVILIPTPEEPLIQKLRKLGHALDKLGRKIGKNFNKMEAKIAEVHFVTKILSPAMVMMEYMKDCFVRPGRASIENFKKGYEKHSPITLTYALLTTLDNRITNPMKLYVDAEKGKTKTTFRKWQFTILRLYRFFVLLESAAIGFLNIKNRKNLDFINKETLIATKKLELWEKELEKDEGYWKETEEFLKAYVSPEGEKNLTLNAMAHVIEKHLASYMTRDCFTIVAMNDGVLHEDFTFHCPKEKERIIGYWGRDMEATIFVYRTRHIEKVSRKDFLKLRDELYDCKELPNWKNLNGIIDTKLIKPGKLQDYGFVVIIDHRNNPFILFVNGSTGGNNYIGNGTFAHLVMKSETGREREFKICASFD